MRTPPVGNGGPDRVGQPRNRCWIQFAAAASSAVFAFVVQPGPGQGDRPGLGLHRRRHARRSKGWTAPSTARSVSTSAWPWRWPPIGGPRAARRRWCRRTAGSASRWSSKGVAQRRADARLVGHCASPTQPSRRRSSRRSIPYVTTVQGNRFRFRGGDPDRMRDSLQKLFQDRLRRPGPRKVEG